MNFQQDSQISRCKSNRVESDYVFLFRFYYAEDWRTLGIDFNERCCTYSLVRCGRGSAVELIAEVFLVESIESSA